MKAAIINEVGQAPVYGEFKNPAPALGKSVIRVTASSISQVTKSRASGSHYSADGALPMIPGIDGTGIGPDGKRVYFVFPEAPYGGMAELCLVDERRIRAAQEKAAKATQKIERKKRKVMQKRAKREAKTARREREENKKAVNREAVSDIEYVAESWTAAEEECWELVIGYSHGV